MVNKEENEFDIEYIKLLNKARIKWNVNNLRSIHNKIFMGPNTVDDKDLFIMGLTFNQWNVLSQSIYIMS